MQDAIRWISTRHEQIAGHMADGFARGAGRPAVCMASRGPGAANLVIAMHNAFAESVPVLAVIGQVDDEIVYRESFEELDMVDLFRPVTKWALEVHDHDRVPELVARAAHATTAGRRRPVMVSLPLDVQIRELPEPAFREDFEVPRRGPRRSRSTVRRRCSRGRSVRSSSSAAVPSTPARRRPSAGSPRRLDAPVAAPGCASPRSPTRTEAFIGCLGFGALPVTETALREADVVLALGARFAQFTTRRYTLPSAGCAVIQVDVDPEELGRVYPPVVAVLGDARATPRRGSRTASRSEGGASAWPGCARTYLTESLLPEAPQAQHGVSSAAVVAALARARDAHDPIVRVRRPDVRRMDAALPARHAPRIVPRQRGRARWGGGCPRRWA